MSSVDFLDQLLDGAEVEWKPLGDVLVRTKGTKIIDFVDTGHPALLRMWDKRQIGYRAMGYRLQSPVAD